MLLRLSFTSVVTERFDTNSLVFEEHVQRAYHAAALERVGVGTRFHFCGAGTVFKGCGPARSSTAVISPSQDRSAGYAGGWGPLQTQKGVADPAAAPASAARRRHTFGLHKTANPVNPA